MKDLKSCFLCGANDFRFLFKNHDRMHGIQGEFSLWKCSCGLVFINPQPDEKEIASFYPQEYGAYQGQDEASTDNFLKKILEQTYYGSRKKSFKRFLLFPLQPLLRSVKVQKNARLLDVGCGEGTFLDKMKKYEMEVQGVDFSEVAISRAKEKGLSVFHGSLKEARFPNEFFDVITINHVFEHLYDPIETLVEIKRILKKDGVVILGTPNVDSLGSHLFGKFWMPLETPRHLFLYSMRTMRLISKKVGFKIVKQSFQSYPWYFLFSIHYWLNRFRHKEILGVNAKLPSSTFLKLGLFPGTTFLSWGGLGDCMQVWLKKD